MMPFREAGPFSGEVDTGETSAELQQLCQKLVCCHRAVCPPRRLNSSLSVLNTLRIFCQSSCTFMMSSVAGMGAGDHSMSSTEGSEGTLAPRLSDEPSPPRSGVDQLTSQLPLLSLRPRPLLCSSSGWMLCTKPPLGERSLNRVRLFWVAGSF